MLHLLIWLIVIFVLLNVLGGVAMPTYRTGRYYGPSWGAIIVIVVVLYLLGVR